ncbi:MAG TPA: phage holin family protein, partial [Pseudonocardiaceae bacterium]
LVICAIAALALVLPVWLAALLVGVGVLLGSGLVALIGRFALRRALPLFPTWAMTSAREDVQTIARGAHQ